MKLKPDDFFCQGCAMFEWGEHIDELERSDYAWPSSGIRGSLEATSRQMLGMIFFLDRKHAHEVSEDDPYRDVKLVFLSEMKRRHPKFTDNDLDEAFYQALGWWEEAYGA